MPRIWVDTSGIHHALSVHIHTANGKIYPNIDTFLFLALSSNGQEINKVQLYGCWQSQSGESKNSLAM